MAVFLTFLTGLHPLGASFPCQERSGWLQNAKGVTSNKWIQSISAVVTDLTILQYIGYLPILQISKGCLYFQRPVMKPQAGMHFFHYGTWANTWRCTSQLLHTRLQTSEPCASGHSPVKLGKAPHQQKALMRV